MKIAILTLPLHLNYGGILQAFALQHTLEKMGADIRVLQHKWKTEKTSRAIFLKNSVRAFFRFLIKDRHTIIFPERYLQKHSSLFSQHIDKFIKGHIKTLYLEDLTDLKYYDFDAIVVGSDQIWRPQYFKKMWEKPVNYSYLSFIGPNINIKKIAYACSFGCNSWEYNVAETESCKNVLNDFSLVSVREISGVDMVKEHFGITPSHVLDPTMLLTKEEYENLIPKSSSSSDFIFSYILDDNDQINRLVQKISYERNLDIKNSRIKPVIKRGQLHSNILIPIEEWLRNIRDANLIITDSFHACVFSIIFNKPFVVVGNANRGQSRFTSLLKTFGLEAHLISDENDYNPCTSYSLPKAVQLKLDEFRSYSLDILRHSIE